MGLRAQGQPAHPLWQSLSCQSHRSLKCSSCEDRGDTKDCRNPSSAILGRIKDVCCSDCVAVPHCVPYGSSDKSFLVLIRDLSETLRNGPGALAFQLSAQTADCRSNCIPLLVWFNLIFWADLGPEDWAEKEYWWSSHERTISWLSLNAGGFGQVFFNDHRECLLILNLLTSVRPPSPLPLFTLNIQDLSFGVDKNLLHLAMHGRVLSHDRFCKMLGPATTTKPRQKHFKSAQRVLEVPPTNHL